eukprot:scaffold19864_cov22-Tisochrysis_lutea.AAC.1
MIPSHPLSPCPCAAQDMIAPAQLKDFDPSQVIIVTTGSQAEPRAQLSLAALDQSALLKIQPDDLILYRTFFFYLGVTRTAWCVSAQGSLDLHGSGIGLFLPYAKVSMECDMECAQKS